MAQDHLGLFDTPPNRQEIRFGLVIVGLLFVALPPDIAMLDIRLREINAFIPMIDAIMFLGELITATLLYAQASVFRSRALTVLATGFVFRCIASRSARADVSRRLCPGRTAWRRGQHHSVDLYLPAGGVSHRRHSLCPAQAGGVGGAAWIGTTGGRIVAWCACGNCPGGGGYAADDSRTRLAPAVLSQSFWTRFTTMRSGINPSLFALYLVATAVLFRKRSSVLDMWLLVALSGWLVQSLLNLPIHAPIHGWLVQPVRHDAGLRSRRDACFDCRDQLALCAAGSIDSGAESGTRGPADVDGRGDSRHLP